MGRLPDQALKVSMPGIPGNAAAVAVKCGGKCGAKRATTRNLEQR